MEANFNINLNDFENFLEVNISKVLRGTKRATKAACEEILANSLDQVPRDTNTLADSAFYEVLGSYSNFTGIVGYGGNGDPVNPRTLQPASYYMIAVHEDLSAHHPTGKAKFLEDPVNDYAVKFAPNAASIISQEIEGGV